MKIVATFKMASRILSRLLSKRAFNTSAARKSIQEEFLAEEKHAEGIIAFSLALFSFAY